MAARFAPVAPLSVIRKVDRVLARGTISICTPELFGTIRLTVCIAAAKAADGVPRGLKDGYGASIWVRPAAAIGMGCGGR